MPRAEALLSLPLLQVPVIAGRVTGVSPAGAARHPRTGEEGPRAGGGEQKPAASPAGSRSAGHRSSAAGRRLQAPVASVPCDGWSPCSAPRLVGVPEVTAMPGPGELRPLAGVAKPSGRGPQRPLTPCLQSSRGLRKQQKRPTFVKL